MKWIIAFCCAIGNGDISEGEFIIKSDTIEIFDYKWIILPESKPVHVTYFKDRAYSNLIKMNTYVGKDTIDAYFLMKGEMIVVNIPKLNKVVTMNQKEISN